MEKDTKHAKAQAKTQLSSIKELVKALKKADKKDNSEARESAQQAILEDVLSVELRSGWSTNPEEFEVAEYKILLCWGGPAVQIVGELDNSYPSTAVLQYQDWGIPWTDYRITAEEEKILIEYASQFYFGG